MIRKPIVYNINIRLPIIIISVTFLQRNTTKRILTYNKNKSTHSGNNNSKQVPEAPFNLITELPKNKLPYNTRLINGILIETFALFRRRDSRTRII